MCSNVVLLWLACLVALLRPCTFSLLHSLLLSLHSPITLKIVTTIYLVRAGTTVERRDEAGATHTICPTCLAHVTHSQIRAPRLHSKKAQDYDTTQTSIIVFTKYYVFL
jgi:hypothetical protein